MESSGAGGCRVCELDGIAIGDYKCSAYDCDRDKRHKNNQKYAILS